jgi:hypothetical protein
LFDEFEFGTMESYEEDVNGMTERLVSQLGSLDVALDEKFGGDHDTSCSGVHITGHTAEVSVYLTHEQTVLIGEGKSAVACLIQLLAEEVHSNCRYS